MKMNIYCIKDKKGAFDCQLTLFDSDVKAKRWFTQFILDVAEKNYNSPIIQFADDFSLLKVGEFNCDTGEFITTMTRDYILSPSEILNLNTVGKKGE